MDYEINGIEETASFKIKCKKCSETNTITLDKQTIKLVNDELEELEDQDMILEDEEEYEPY